MDIDAKDYQRAIEIYHLFSCTAFGEYHDIYLTLDVYLLGDIFEKFRNTCTSVYELDPVHFFSAPNLSWEVMLISTKVEIELLSDIDMLLFCENAFRGGINEIGALRTFSANNKYMQNYKANEESVFGAFFDVPSLYAGTMEQPLPLGDYVWRSDRTLNDFSADPLGDIEYMVEIDLHYPSYLHSSHNDLPLAPQKLQINPDWLSSYALSFGLKRSSTAKLVETLFDKLNYVCHFRNLQFYVQQGLQVQALHKVLHFKQSSWLGEYNSKNTSMRKGATSDFEKNFFKFTSNACFGKTMENLRNRPVIKFVVNEMQAKKVTFKPNFKSFNINQDLVSVHLKYFHCMEQIYASWSFNFGLVKACFI